VDSVAYSAQTGSFESAVETRGTMAVDGAVGSKLVYNGGSWALIRDDANTGALTSDWFSIPDLFSAADAQDALNNDLTGDEGLDAKVTGGDNDAVRLTYPLFTLDTTGVTYYWDLKDFDTFLDAMTWAQNNLSTLQNRGLKIYYSDSTAVYHVLYPVPPAIMAVRWRVPLPLLSSIVAARTRTVYVAAAAAARPRLSRKLVDWKGVFADLGQKPR
jgi:hypothetical protein